MYAIQLRSETHLPRQYSMAFSETVAANEDTYHLRCGPRLLRKTFKEERSAEVTTKGARHARKQDSRNEIWGSTEGLYYGNDCRVSTLQFSCSHPSREHQRRNCLPAITSGRILRCVTRERRDRTHEASYLKRSNGTCQCAARYVYVLVRGCDSSPSDYTRESVCHKQV